VASIPPYERLDDYMLTHKYTKYCNQESGSIRQMVTELTFIP